jgi:hypothetical protein
MRNQRWQKMSKIQPPAGKKKLANNMVNLQGSVKQWHMPTQIVAEKCVKTMNQP